jgi:hypothetical protein
MEPMTIIAGIGALAGALGSAGGKGGKTTNANQTTVSNPINIVMPSTQTFGLALTNNPTIANIIGPGATIAPASGGSYLPQSVAPNVNAPLDNTTSPNLNANDGTNPGGILPRTSPTGNLGLGAGFAQPRTAFASNDLFLILIIAGGAFLLIQTQ